MTNIGDVKGLYFSWNFESTEELLAYVSNPASHVSEGKGDSNGKWNGTSTWDEAIDLATRGSPKDREQALEMYEKLQTAELRSLVGEAEEESYDVSGAYVDVGLFCEGEPECMIEWDEVRADAPRVVTIYVVGGTASEVSSAYMARRGASIACLVDMLENTGIRAEVVQLAGSKGWKPTDLFPDAFGDTTWIRWVTKKAEQPLDVDRLAYALSNPSAQRRLIFNVRGHSKHCPGTQGMPPTLDLRTVVPSGDIVVPNLTASNSTFSSNAGAIEWVRKTFTKQIE